MGNFMKIKILTILLLIASYATGQVDSSLQFLKSKGTWQFPIRDIKRIERIDDEKFNNTIGCFPIVSTTFISDTKSDVRSVFEGNVDIITKVEDFYIVALKYGGYYVFYTGLDSPIVKVNQKILRGQKLGYTSVNNEKENYIDISLIKDLKPINISDWFISKNCP